MGNFFPTFPRLMRAFAVTHTNIIGLRYLLKTSSDLTWRLHVTLGVYEVLEQYNAVPYLNSMQHHSMSDLTLLWRRKSADALESILCMQSFVAYQFIYLWSQHFPRSKLQHTWFTFTDIYLRTKWQWPAKGCRRLPYVQHSAWIIFETSCWIEGPPKIGHCRKYRLHRVRWRIYCFRRTGTVYLKSNHVKFSNQAFGRRHILIVCPHFGGKRKKICVINVS